MNTYVLPLIPGLAQMVWSHLHDTLWYLQYRYKHIGRFFTCDFISSERGWPTKLKEICPFGFKNSLLTIVTWVWRSLHLPYLPYPGKQGIFKILRASPSFYGFRQGQKLIYFTGFPRREKHPFYLLLF